MLQRTIFISSPAASYTRYALVIGLITAAGVATTHLVISDLVTSAQSQPQARELSRVELVMRAKDTAFVYLPSQDRKGEPAVESQVVASNLAVEIDNAELADTPPIEAGLSVQPSSAPVVAEVQIDAKLLKKSQRLAAQKKARANATAELKSPESAAFEVATFQPPAPQLASLPTLKTAVQAEYPPKTEPLRKKLARKNPNAGELVRMQLLNLI